MKIVYLSSPDTRNTTEHDFTVTVPTLSAKADFLYNVHELLSRNPIISSQRFTLRVIDYKQSGDEVITVIRASLL